MDDSYVPVGAVETDGTLRWRIWASVAPSGIGNQYPGVETLMTRVRIEGPGVEDSWGFGGPKLYPGDRIHYGHSRCDGLPVFVLAQFDPGLDVVYVETTGRTVAVSTADLAVTFGLKFCAMPLRVDEELVSVVGDREDRVRAASWPELPPGARVGWLPSAD